MGLLQLKRLMLGRNTILSLPPSVSYDSNALAYISAVETADGQALETGVRNAINAFVVGCKADGTWNAIKACCILSGARTLSGALVPLVGTAPTNYNFVSGDYNRKTGLIGNSATKFLDSNRNNNADPQNSRHLTVYRSEAGATAGAGLGGLIGTLAFASGNSHLSAGFGSFSERLTNATSSSRPVSTATGAVFYGASRTGSANYQVRLKGVVYNYTFASVAPVSQNINVFDVAFEKTDARLSFYSIGEAIDLALFDARVATLISAYAAVIP
jgi:hypothetical protein